MTSTRNVPAAALLVAAALVTLACGGSASPAAAPAKPASQPPSGAASGGGAAPSAGSASHAAPGPRQHIRVAYGAAVGSMVPIIAANKLGEWTSEGLDVEVDKIPSNTSVAALVAGELDLVQVSAPALINADVGGGADLLFAAGALDKYILGVWAMPGINTAADLRGKTIGSDRPGTPVAYAVDVTLKRLGLAQSDVQVLPLGTDGMIPGLESGQLQAASMTLPQIIPAQHMGAHLMVNLYDLPYQNIGLIMRRGDMDRLAPAMPGLLRVYRQGIERFLQDERWGREVLVDLLDTNDEEQLQQTYDFFAKTVPFTPSLRVSREGLQAVLDSLKDTLPGAATANIDTFYDHRFVDQLDQGR
ncbi:MAG TPA: ABC transporter substrate-binding protein [Chloroflexota bacterium]|jgi:ABC-type nitrate/sulfonate/bicarbonate transport system substrate-binding protein